MSLHRSLRRHLAQPLVREFVLWCLPALLLGLAVRLVLASQLPRGLYHTDTPDFLTTPDSLLFLHRFELHSKKTFLVPILFTFPFLLHLPALIFIPLAQNALGLGIVVLTGLLCRLWFARWKLFFLPLTVIAAVNPYLLWYERTLMAETTFLFCTMLLALAGTLYTLAATRRHFVFLCLALVLEAGARPEGKLLFGFGIFLLLLLHRHHLRRGWPRLAVMLVLAVGMHFLTRTSQAGLLLYTSVVRLTPPDLKIAPGFDPFIAPVRAELQARWETDRTFPKVRDRRVVAGAVQDYLRSRHLEDRTHTHDGVNAFCTKLALETCRRNFLTLPVLAYYKFRFTASEAPSGAFDKEWVFDRQHSAYAGELDRAARLATGLTGQPLSTEAEFQAWVDAHYATVPWFNAWTDLWLNTMNFFRMHDQLERSSRVNGVTLYPGLPLYFGAAAMGLLITMFRRGTLQPLHLAWGLTLCGLWFTIILTANTKPRFRFVFEPFWYLYLGLLLDTAVLALQALTLRVRPVSAEQPEPALS